MIDSENKVGKATRYELVEQLLGSTFSFPALPRYWRSPSLLYNLSYVPFLGRSPPGCGVVPSSTVYVQFYTCTAAILPAEAYYDVTSNFKLIDSLMNIPN